MKWPLAYAIALVWLIAFAMSTERTFTNCLIAFAGMVAIYSWLRKLDD